MLRYSDAPFRPWSFVLLFSWCVRLNPSASIRPWIVSCFLGFTSLRARTRARNRVNKDSASRIAHERPCSLGRALLKVVVPILSIIIFVVVGQTLHLQHLP